MDKIFSRSRASVVAVFLLSALSLTQNSHAAYGAENDPATASRLTVMEENDYFVSHDDRHFTQGLRVSYLTGEINSTDNWNAPYVWLGDNLPIYEGGNYKRRYEITAGQSIFTPTNVEAEGIVRRDRPYAAWLYTGASLLQETSHETHHTLENFEGLVGVVGPAALGGVTQNTFHQFIGDTASLGWRNELKNEPGFVVTYERKWRFQQPLFSNFAVDAIPEIGASGGNILTYAETGLMLRMGQNLGADYGADRIRPSLSGTSWFDPGQMHGPLGWYIFAGAQGRAVGHNIFLDGNSWASSPSVQKKNLVADFIGGASLFWSSSVRTDFTITQRTKEFYGQQGHPDRFGGVNLVIGF